MSTGQFMESWVQCDLCDKWRKVPPTINISALTGVWRCSDNHWDAYNNCEVDEQLCEDANVWIYNDSNTQAAVTIVSNRRAQHLPPLPLDLQVLFPPVQFSPSRRSRSVPVSVGRQTIPLQAK